VANQDRDGEFFYALNYQLAAILLAMSPRWYLYQSLGFNFLWMLPWAIVVTKISIAKSTEWTYYAIIFGEALIFDCLDVGISADLGDQVAEIEKRKEGDRYGRRKAPRTDCRDRGEGDSVETSIGPYVASEGPMGNQGFRNEAGRA
jgi:hypothetical protein